MFISSFQHRLTSCQCFLLIHHVPTNLSMSQIHEPIQPAFYLAQTQAIRSIASVSSLRDEAHLALRGFLLLHSCLDIMVLCTWCWDLSHGILGSQEMSDHATLSLHLNLSSLFQFIPSTNKSPERKGNWLVNKCVSDFLCTPSLFGLSIVNSFPSVILKQKSNVLDQ